MAPHVLAFSIDKQIEQVGAICGFVAILGLAVLALLYFAQAREVKRLREWAGRAPERDAELQARVAEDAARRASGQPAAAPATAAASAAAKPQPASTPATAAGQTQVVKPATPGAPAGAVAAAAATPGAADKPATPGTPAPAPTSAGAAAPATPAATAATGAAAARPRRTVPLGATPASATVPRRDDPEEHGSLFNAKAVVATVLAAVLVVVVLLVSGVVGGSDDKTGGSSKAADTTASPASTTASGATIPAPEDTAVAVLNGTTVTGLAKQAADRLQARGYQVPTTTDAADQATQTSQVAYSDGFEGSAKRVAKIVGVSSSQIVPLDASTRAVAGDAVSVVVTMGLDKAS
jgi:hypothetical protein